MIKIESAEELNHAVTMLSAAEDPSRWGTNKGRTTYLRNNMDIRRCPKNGSSSILQVYGAYLKSQGLPGFDMGLNYVAHHARPTPELLDRTPGIEKYQFRIDSYRVTIKRDPIDRIISAVKYIYKTYGGNDNPDPKEVNRFLEIGDLNSNHHFWPQSYFLMDRNVYDRIVDISELDDFIIELCEKNRLEYDPNVFRDNRTTDRITVDDLSSMAYNRLKEHYKIDYDNGWY